MNQPKYAQSTAGFGDAFPGSAGPFVTPGNSPYQHSGSAASLTGFGTVVNHPSELNADRCPYTDASACARWESEQASKRAKADMDRVRADLERSREAREKSPLNMLGTALGWTGSVAGVYHGYKRNNGSVGWALAWGLIGGIWPISIPLMLAQGFGKPLPKVAAANRRKAKRNGFKIRTGDLVPLGRLVDIDDSQRDMVAYRSTSGWDFEVRKFASRQSMKDFLKKEARRSDYHGFGRREWEALVKDVVGKNMVAYPSFETDPSFIAAIASSWKES